MSQDSSHRVTKEKQRIVPENEQVVTFLNYLIFFSGDFILSQNAVGEITEFDGILRILSVLIDSILISAVGRH